MADELITRKDLLKQIDKIKLKDWKRAAEKLGLVLTQPSGGSSHFAIRKPGYEANDIRGLVTNVYEDLHKPDKPKVFKRLLAVDGIEEDDVWKALGMLKRK